MPALLLNIANWLSKIGLLVTALMKAIRWLPKLGSAFKKLFATGGFFQRIWIFIRQMWVKVNDKWFTMLTYVGVFFTWIVEKLQKLLSIPFICGCLWFIVRFLVKFIAKHPFLSVIALVYSDFFPSIMGTIFRIQGLIALRIAIPLISYMFDKMRSIGASEIDAYSDAMKGALDSLPPCIGSHIAYLDVAGDLGLLISAFGLCVTYRIMAMAYGSFLKK